MGRRGVLPLALLIVAALGVGIAFALIRAGEAPPKKAGPTPTKSSVSPTTKPTKTSSPTTMSPSTESPSMESPESPESPTTSPTRTKGGGGGGNHGRETPSGGGTPLASTGGAPAVWLILGAGLIGLSALLARLARRPF